MGMSPFDCLKQSYLSLSRFRAVQGAREWVRNNFQLRYWPWYRLPPHRPGTDPSARYEHELIVSLTSFPARIHLVHYAIHSLLKQSLKPNRIVLWLADSQFPGKEKDLPTGLLSLKPFGLEIRWCEDLKSFKKLIPALREFPGAIHVTADDDMRYSRHWLRSLYQSWQEHPKNITAGGIHPIALDDKLQPLPYAEWGWNPPDSFPSFQNIQVGAFGVLYPPHCLHPEVLDSLACLRISPSSDDFWFWAHGVRAGTRVRLVPNGRRQPPVGIPDGNATPSLYSVNGRGGGNDTCMANLLRAYPEILSLLAAEPLQIVTPWGGDANTATQNFP